MTTGEKIIKNKLGLIKLAKTKIYHSLEEIQEDADKWIEEYNTQRTHSGKYCFGKTPWQTFLDSKHLADEKMLDRLQSTDTNVREVSRVR